MTRDEAKEEVLSREPDFLDRANDGKSWVCPEETCRNGTGGTGDGLARNPHGDGRHYKCFKCGLNEDVIGLWKKHTGITDDKAAFDSLYERCGIHIDEAGEGRKPFLSAETSTKPAETKAVKCSRQAERKTADYSEYFGECRGRISQTDYPARRGLSAEVVKRFGLGFDPKFKPSSGGRWAALIIPTGKGSFAARNTDPNTDHDRRYEKRGSVPVYCAPMLEKERPCFVVEGELDALSIIDAGGCAVGLGGADGSCRALVEIVKRQEPKPPLILMLDLDDAGQRSADKLEAALTAAGCSVSRHHCPGFHDANEALKADRELFRKWVSDTEAQARAALAADKEKELAEYLKTSTVNFIQDFQDGIHAGANMRCISTGFAALDYHLDGGLYDGLYIAGGVSAVGKTTLALQIMDQIAEGGNDVLIFSLEMSRAELMARSISRLTRRFCRDERLAKTIRGITCGARYQGYSEEEHALINDAVQRYRSYADKLFIHEGVGSIGVAQVRDTVEKHISITGRRPVVLVDYLQMLAPFNERATDKQIVDRAVLELKRLSRDCRIPVFVISSFNRGSYNREAGFESFKESGSVEYSADVLLGLQLEGVETTNFNKDDAMGAQRTVELIILKNRNGAVRGRVKFDYMAMFNWMRERLDI